MISFRAHCARGHDRQDYTDPAAFEAHMIGEHKACKIAVGDACWQGSLRVPALDTPRPGGLPNSYLRPSRAPKDTRKLTAVLAKAANRNEDSNYPGGRQPFSGVAEGWHTDDMVKLTDLRTGDVFVLGGREYTLHDRDGWLITLKAERGRRGIDVPTRPRNIEDRMGETVWLVKRAPRPRRYDQCDETCTTDCGHCKGAGSPTERIA